MGVGRGRDAQGVIRWYNRQCLAPDHVTDYYDSDVDVDGKTINRKECRIDLLPVLDADTEGKKI